jgi:hypothetical protein
MGSRESFTSRNWRRMPAGAGFAADGASQTASVDSRLRRGVPARVAAIIVGEAEG